MSSFHEKYTLFRVPHEHENTDATNAKLTATFTTVCPNVGILFTKKKKTLLDLFIFYLFCFILFLHVAY